MWPDEKAVREELERRVTLIEEGKLLEEPHSHPYKIARLVWMSVNNDRKT